MVRGLIQATREACGGPDCQPSAAPSVTCTQQRHPPATMVQILPLGFSKAVSSLPRLQLQICDGASWGPESNRWAPWGTLHQVADPRTLPFPLEQ